MESSGSSGSGNGKGSADDPGEGTSTGGAVRTVKTRASSGSTRGRTGGPASPFIVGIGVNPVMGESFCTCPAVTQGRYRYLDCQCGEEDNGNDTYYI